MNNEKPDLVKIYREMSEERRDEEISALFEIAFAMLEATDCDALESFPNPNIRITIKCEVIEDGSGYYN